MQQKSVARRGREIRGKIHVDVAAPSIIVARGAMVNEIIAKQPADLTSRIFNACMVPSSCS